MKIIIERLNDDGDGIGYLDKKIIFVPGTLPGETCDIEIITSKKKFDIANLNEVLVKSDSRVEPLCKYYDLCGGCDLMHMKYADQVKFKKDKLQNIFSRNFDYKNNIEVICSDQFHYRNKVTLKVTDKVGYCQKNSNKIIRINECLLAKDKINTVVRKLNNLDLSVIDEIIIKDASNGLMLVIIAKQAIDTMSFVESLSGIVTSVYLNNQLVYGDEYITDNMLGRDYLISADSFYQVNKMVTEKLYCDIKKNVLGSNIVLDLYAGVGTISTLISDSVALVDAVEINASAVASAKEMLNLNHINNVNMVLGDAAKVIETLDKKYDTVIVDPPRAGLSNYTIDYIKKIDPNKLIYVSCNPNTLVRDLKLLNYKIEFVKGYDMFANTKHVETLVVLSK